MRAWVKRNGAVLLVFVLSSCLFVGAHVLNVRSAEIACHSSNDARAISNRRAKSIRKALRLAATEHPADADKWRALVGEVPDTPLRDC